MRPVRLIGYISALLVWSYSASAVPIYGVSAFVFTDAGNAHTFQNVQFDPVANVATTGVITQALADNAFFGAQSAATSAYASVGALGGKVQAFSAFGSSPSSAQAADDLSWYFDWTPTGIAGTKVQVQFSQLFEGSVAGAGRDDRGYSGGTRSTTFIANSLFGDFDFNAAVNPGPFSVLVSKVYEFDVGQVVRLGSRLTVGGHAELDSTILVDAFNTSKFFIDVLTPGAGYNSSDFLFPTLLTGPEPTPGPTPVMVSEPSSLALFGLALCALVLASVGGGARFGRTTAA